MKTLKLISIVLILSLASCRTTDLERLKSHRSEIIKEQAQLKNTLQESIQSRQHVITSDSGTHIYSIRIVPLDTFSFSFENGFKGKAASLELASIIQKDMEAEMTGNLTFEKASTKQSETQLKAIKTEKVVTKKMRKTKWLIFGVIISLGIGWLIYWWVKKA